MTIAVYSSMFICSYAYNAYVLSRYQAKPSDFDTKIIMIWSQIIDDAWND